MRKLVQVAGIAVAVATGAPSPDAVAAAAKCTSIQAQCAVEVGGTCDPNTGRWEYGRRGGAGNTLAFNECISRKSGKK